VKKPKHNISCAGHLRAMLSPAIAKHTVRQVVKMVRARNIEFDAIACRGVSGLLIAPIVAMRLNKTLIVVRKGENTHSPYTVEGDHGANTYLILDDFIDVGDTVRQIAKEIYVVNPKARCAGFIAYSSLSYKDTDHSFKEEMENAAWWDGHNDFLRFFPEKYVTAVQEETA
jgi:adenine/guanine phosphoribosyltransferase-like PRPP-binding protein